MARNGSNQRATDASTEKWMEELEIREPLCAVFRRRLKDAGQKYTPERAQILDTILKIDDLFEAEDLQEALRGSFSRCWWSRSRRRTN